MPIHAPPETLTALGGGLLPQCHSRSLFQERFADPQATDKTHPTRKEWFNAFITKHASDQIPMLDWLPESTENLHARLMSRLMVNLAGGVMENANVSLDRYGLPLIPGTAIKGCARRMALQALHDWMGAPASPGPYAEDDPTIPCRTGHTPAEMLATIARIFGWTPDDWRTGKKKDLYLSDFDWAVQGDEAVMKEARALLPIHPTFAGTIAFLSASPNHDPKLELDVVTPHHCAYYESADPHKIATDTEDPVPVYFPAVARQSEGDYFTFPLIPLRLAADGDLYHSKNWLAHGLETFGLGAKTNAGYGWFEMRQTNPGEQIDLGDFANETIFQNAIINRLNKPQEYQSLQIEIEKLKLQKNIKWLEQLKSTLLKDEMKPVRKQLRSKDWFPNEWLERPQN